LRPERVPSFAERFAELFEAQFPRLFRTLNRLSGDRELASDVAQDAFVRLYRRGAMPDSPEAWLISVAMNLFRNAASTRSRRARLLTPARAEQSVADAPAAPDEDAEAADSRLRVRATLDRMPERERGILLLRAEGFSYRDIAAALRLNEASIGVLLARAKAAFRAIYEEPSDEP